jgi:hypothetical protein
VIDASCFDGMMIVMRVKVGLWKKRVREAVRERV